MTDRYLITVLEEAEYVAEQHHQVARTADNQVHEYLRYAVLRILEGQADHLPTDWTPIDGVTVGYGTDEAMFDSWDSSEDWWETVPPQESCTRFRVFFPDDHQTVPRTIVDVMAALGAWRVWAGAQPRVAPTTIASAAKSTTCGRKAIRSRKCSTSGSVALRKPSLQTVVGLATSATVWSSTMIHSHRMTSSHARSVPSTKRWTSRSSRKVVATRSSPRPVIGTKSTSSTSRVLVPTGSSAHLRVAASIYVALTTRSNEAAFPDQTAAFPPRSRDRTTPQDGLCRHLDEPGRALVAHKWG